MPTETYRPGLAYVLSIAIEGYRTGRFILPVLCRLRRSSLDRHKEGRCEKELRVLGRYLGPGMIRNRGNPGQMRSNPLKPQPNLYDLRRFQVWQGACADTRNSRSRQGRGGCGVARPMEDS